MRLLRFARNDILGWVFVLFQRSQFNYGRRNHLSSEGITRGGYEARALGYSIFTEADTFEELKEMAKDAVRCHFEDTERPRLIRLHLVKEEVIPA